MWYSLKLKNAHREVGMDNRQHRLEDIKYLFQYIPLHSFLQSICFQKFASLIPLTFFVISVFLAVPALVEI